MSARSQLLVVGVIVVYNTCTAGIVLDCCCGLLLVLTSYNYGFSTFDAVCFLVHPHTHTHTVYLGSP